MPLFCTCSYSEFRAGVMVGIPVRTSNGYPRWKLGYPLVHALPLLYPDRSTLSMTDQAQFAELYIRKLNGAGVEMIRLDALAIRQQVGAGDDVPLVVCCFEKLTVAGKWCHRSIFGAWWEARTGEPVPELGGRRIPELRSSAAPTVLPCDGDADDDHPPDTTLF